MSTQALSFGASRKRKERDGADGFRAPPEPAHKPKLKPILEPKQPIFKPTLEPKPVVKPAASNLILAGYLAHEFLTSGTLFGKPFPPPARADPHRPGSSSSAQPSPRQTKPPAKAYADVSRLMMGDGGVHVPGVFNPTQLASWLQM